MQWTVIALASGLAGVLVGALGVWGYLVSRPAKQTTPAPALPELPAGVSEVLGVLRSAAIVLDVADTVVRASPAAYAYGLVKAGRVMHQDLLRLASSVRLDRIIVEQDLDLARGPLGKNSLAVHARLAPLGNMHVLILVEDRTEARRVDEVRRDFVANVSHELKTPIGGILLLCEAIEEAADDPDAVRRFASRLAIESQRLADLVRDIIDFSRLQVYQGVEEPQLIDVADVLHEAEDRSRVLAEGRGVTLKLGAVNDLWVYGDRGLLVTAVRNLVDNAIRYSEPNTHVGIGASVENGLIHIKVTDQGVGIPGSEQERVFERFYRVDPARSRQTGGTGLGLSIVKHIAGHHGGDVTVWSRPGEGSTFTLRVPSASDQETSPSQEPAVLTEHRIVNQRGLPPA